MSTNDGSLTRDSEDATMSPMGPEELQVVLRVLATKLPPVLQALEDGKNGWRQTMTITAYLLSATVHRHPEYTGAIYRLLATFDDLYPKIEAEFAKSHPGAVSELIKHDLAFFIVPSTEVKADQKTQ